MDELFGVSMNYIMYALVALLFVALVSVAYVVLTNRVMFKIGVRNIPRRRAQTTLIIIGVMLSTIIIAAAFTTGDTVDRSITSEVYSIYGSLDEQVQVRTVSESSFEDQSEALLREDTFSAASVAPVIEKLRSDPEVDYVIPAYSDLAVAINPDKKLSSPLFNVLGLDLQASRGLPDIVSTGGQHLELSDLGPNEIYVNKSAADDIDIAAGDTIQIVTLGKTATFRVKDIVQDKRLAGAGGISVRREGGVLPLTAVQDMFGVPGQLTVLAISNRGDAREGLKYAKGVEARIQPALASLKSTGGAGLAVQSVKQTGVDIAEAGGNLFATLFLVFGLFGIGAGALLIFLIFVMLAAERKAEMGISRAIGLKRADLIQTFLSEGMGYNLLAAAVGVGLGVIVSFVVTRIMASIFSQVDISVSPYVTPRSLIISYSLGVVLTFLTVTISSWRVSNLNIVQAIRDIPEPPMERPAWGRRGRLLVLRDLFLRPTDRAGWIRRGAMSLAVLLAVAGLTSGVLPLLALAGLLVLGVFANFAFTRPGMPAPMRAGLLLAMVLFAPVTLAAAFLMTFQLGPLFILVSLPLMAIGAAQNSAFPLLFGLSALPLGIALTSRTFGANERLTFTLTGIVLLYIWEFDFSVGLIDRIFGKTDGGPEMFFLSGVMITTAATFLVVYNADLILGLLTRLGRRLGALLPSMKMAVAYPLANRSRTGMTMAMFCLVVFALIVMSSLNHNFNRVFLSDRSLGGWDVSVGENPTNPIQDLRAALQQTNPQLDDEIDGIGLASVATRFRARACEPAPGGDCPVPASGTGPFSEYPVWGDDQGFLHGNRIPLQARAKGYSSDHAVWEAIAGNPNLAVVDVNAVGSGGFGASSFIKSVDSNVTSFDPIDVTLWDRTTGKTGRVTVIGFIDFGSSVTYSGIHVAPQKFQEVFGRPDLRVYYVDTKSGTNNVQFARGVEAALITTGAQAESIRKQINDLTATQRNFFYLLQGFMGLGLVVGVAAVGVIAFRTVVERRQQIGMMRAIGYTRRMIATTFLLESGFIAFMGVLSGIVFALILARQLITDQFASQGATGFSVPWIEVGVIGALAFGFALLMTLIPSRQAANIPIAQALRYE